MHKNLKNTIKVGSIILIIICAFVAGHLYNSRWNVESNEIGVGNSNNYNLESSSKLALSLSDLPSDWEIAARGDMVAHDKNDYQRNLGWEEGYNILFQKINSPNIYATQYVSKYSEKNIDLTLNETKTKIKQFNEGIGGNKIQYLIDINGDKYRYDRLADQNLGDESIAYKESHSDYPDYFVYHIDFRKGNHVEELESPDYELLKYLAKKAEKRVV